MKNVLIIEDDYILRLRYARDLEWKVNLYFASNLTQAQDMVRNKIKELDIISFDLFLSLEEEDNIPKDTIWLIKDIKELWFEWVMIASSAIDKYRQDQLSSWCNSENLIKRKLAEHILSIIS